MNSEKSKRNKILIKLIEILIIVILIIIIIYLIKSENGILRSINKKEANKKLNIAIEKYLASDRERQLEDYIMEIEGLEEIDIDRVKGKIDLKIDGEELFVILEEI